MSFFGVRGLLRRAMTAPASSGGQNRGPRWCDLPGRRTTADRGFLDNSQVSL
jgi:hypothetical protein